MTKLTGTNWNHGKPDTTLRQEAVKLAYKFVPLPSGCSNCWGDLGEGCTDECRRSSAKHSEKIDEAVNAIEALITSEVRKAQREAARNLSEQITRYGDGAIAYHNGEATVLISKVLAQLNAGEVE